MNEKLKDNLIYRGGSSLVMVLWIFVLLTVITAVVAQTSRLDTRIAAVTGDKLRCKWACRAGMELAIGILNDDDAAYDIPEDLWSDNPEELKNVPVKGCTFSVEVIDESSKLNINTLNAKTLMYLPDMTEEIANSIIDWRDKNDDLRPGSAEGGYYLNLPHPYQVKNKAFTTIRELLRVKDVTDELFYGIPGSGQFSETSDENIIVNEGWINYLTCYSQEINKDAEGKKRLNVSSASEGQMVNKLGLSKSHAKWIVENRKKGFKSLGDLISSSSSSKKKSSKDNSKNKSTSAVALDLETVLSIVDKACVSGKKVLRGKININTASKVVLTTLFSGKDSIADDIIAYRQSQPYGIEDFEQLAEISSLTKTILKKTLGLISLRSETFTIKSFATANLTDSTLYTEAVVNRTKSPVQIIYFCQGAKF
jgi:general secretion pathway protein K